MKNKNISLQANCENRSTVIDSSILCYCCGGIRDNGVGMGDDGVAVVLVVWLLVMVIIEMVVMLCKTGSDTCS